MFNNIRLYVNTQTMCCTCSGEAEHSWLVCGVGQPAKYKPSANRQPTTHARVLVPCKVYRGSKCVQMCVSFLFPDEAGLREREHFGSAKIVRNYAGLQFDLLASPRREGG